MFDHDTWRVPIVSFIGYGLGQLLLPMRWWRHGDIPPVVPLMLCASIGLTLASRRWRALRLVAAAGWIVSGFVLARVLAWIATWNAKVEWSAAVWAATIVAGLVFALAPARQRDA